MTVLRILKLKSGAAVKVDRKAETRMDEQGEETEGQQRTRGGDIGGAEKEEAGPPGTSPSAESAPKAVCLPSKATVTSPFSSSGTQTNREELASAAAAAAANNSANGCGGEEGQGGEAGAARGGGEVNSRLKRITNGLAFNVFLGERQAKKYEGFLSKTAFHDIWYSTVLLLYKKRLSSLWAPRKHPSVAACLVWPDTMLQGVS